MTGFSENFDKCLALSTADVEKFYLRCRKDRLSLAVFYLSLQIQGNIHEITEDFCQRNGEAFDRAYFESRALDTGGQKALRRAEKLKDELSFARGTDSSKLTAKEGEDIGRKLEQYIREQRNFCMATSCFVPFLQKCSPSSQDDGGENDFVIRAIRGMKYWEARYIVYFYNIIMDAYEGNEVWDYPLKTKP